ncbi:MAG: hypothetical protein DRM99_01145 [Thermoplasmata archaeon]|nr:MAG: hypothetical protein DRM99_01145 [Thermoplasmata archaeon]
MPQLENKELLEQLLKSTIEVIGRRTSEAYANVTIGLAFQELTERYSFLKYVKIQGTQYEETFEIVTIQEEINNIDPLEVGKAARHFLNKLTKMMGKDAGYYFLREIKENLPSNYEKTIKEIGVDLDYLQMEFITEVKESFKFQIENSEILKYMITILFEILDRSEGRDSAYNILNELIQRLTIKHPVLKHVKINDIRAVQGVDIVTVNLDVDNVASTQVGVAIQKVIQEINNLLEEKGDHSFVEKLKENINVDYNLKLRDVGVNLDVIKVSQSLIVKHVIKALVEILSESSSKNYAVVLVNNVLRKYDKKFEFLKEIKLESTSFSQNDNGIDIPSVIDSVRASELGRSIQRIIEDISISLGEDAGRYFIDKLKKRLGKAYLLRIEELGVNLHMIELKRNLMW